MEGIIKPSPLTLALSIWETELAEDIDKQFLLNGISSGFCITSAPHQFCNVQRSNYKSATSSDISNQVEAQIVAEINQGNYVICKRQPTIVSSLGAIEKSNGKIRLIHDCSKPEELGLNSYATTSTFKYETVDRAVSLLPPNGYMAKIDLSCAYHVVPVHTECLAATGLQWQFEGSSSPTYMVDCRLPFGASRSPGIFQKLSNSVTHMMVRRGFTVISYLDDYLVISSSKNHCQEGYVTLLQLLQNLGFVINWDKVVPPTQQLVFLGIAIDSVSRCLSLPERKLAELRGEINLWMQKKKATKRNCSLLLVN